jgi:RND family efflux transporter MFP subunit
MIKKLQAEMSEDTRRKVYIFFAIAFTIAVIGIVMHIVAAVRLHFQTNKNAVLTVATIQAKPSPAFEEIVLPGSVQAWHQAPIYARTNGYIKMWMTDIGARVKKGDLLAVIETPELNAQLRQAEADLKTAEANSAVAQTTMVRWKVLLKTDSVSKQDADERIADALAKAALVNAARANKDRLQELVGFENVVAPFDGVITSRTIDIGSLISAGSTTQRPLFSIAQADPLRIYVRIPQNYSARVSPDMIVELHFAEHPGQVFPAKLFETANAINPLSRTLLAQFTMDNKNYEILPGGYTQVHLKFPANKNSVRLPVNALLFRAEGLQIATLDKDSNIKLQSVKIARDFGNEVEIDSGITPGETIVINPQDSLITGQHVRVVSSDGKDDNKDAAK